MRTTTKKGAKFSFKLFFKTISFADSTTIRYHLWFTNIKITIISLLFNFSNLLRSHWIRLLHRTYQIIRMHHHHHLPHSVDPKVHHEGNQTVVHRPDLKGWVRPAFLLWDRISDTVVKLLCAVMYCVGCRLLFCFTPCLYSLLYCVFCFERWIGCSEEGPKRTGHCVVFCMSLILVYPKLVYLATSHF